jgi:probable rRNA maturation factor
LVGFFALAWGFCAREAAEKDVPVDTHARYLVVLGTLHLLGYDHETGDDDAEEMEAIERQALASLGIADPYAVTEVES